MENLKEEWAFVIRTNSYAGNFERYLCAHLTGQISDEDNTGKEYVDENIAELFDDKVKQCPDDNACYRPVGICGEGAKSVSIFFNEKPTKKEIDMMKNRAETFVEKRRKSGHSWDKDFSLEILEFTVDKKEIKITSEQV